MTIGFQSESHSDDEIYSDSSNLPYVVVNLKLLEAALAKIARCHGHESLERDLGQCQSIFGHT